MESLEGSEGQPRKGHAVVPAWPFVLALPQRKNRPPVCLLEFETVGSLAHDRSNTGS
jgi:hypothetical protein